MAGGKVVSLDVLPFGPVAGRTAATKERRARSMTDVSAKLAKLYKEADFLENSKA